MITKVVSGQLPAETIYLSHLAPEVISTLGESLFTAENKSGATLTTGQVVARHSSGSGVILADASGHHAIGLAGAEIENAVSGTIKGAGIVSLDDWSVITGSPTLAPLASYFVSSTAGQLTTVPPTTSGTFTQLIGLAVSPTALQLMLEPPIRN